MFRIHERYIGTPCATAPRASATFILVFQALVRRNRTNIIPQLFFLHWCITSLYVQDRNDFHWSNLS